MKVKLTNNEPLYVESITNNVTKTIDIARDIVVAENPSGGAEEIEDNPSTGGGKPIIYCEIRKGAGANSQDGNALIVRGAEDFLTSEYVPILVRNSNKRSGRGWHHYRSNKNGNGGTIDFVTIDDIVVTNGYEIPPVTAHGVKLGNNFNILAYMPQVYDDKVAHGKRQIRLLKNLGSGKYAHVNFKAKWGLTFIRATDFPSTTDTRLDVEKFVTNVAPFYVYYRWIHDSGNNVWTIHRVLTT